MADAAAAGGDTKKLPEGYVSKTSEKALLGVFSSAGYIDVGNKVRPERARASRESRGNHPNAYTHPARIPPLTWFAPPSATQAKPLPYPVKHHVRSSFTGRQMITNPPKEGLLGSKHPDVYLDKQHAWLSEGVPYVDRLKYAEVQSEKKAGFGTSDFSRRDEFSMDFRTEQYREALKSENRHASEATKKAYLEMCAAMEAAGHALDADGAGAGAKARRDDRRHRPTLFDAVFDDGDVATAVPNSMISGRPSKNPTQTSWERDYGRTKTSAMECGYGVKDAPHGKPQFARMPVLDATVYRPCAIPITASTTIFTKRPE